MYDVAVYLSSLPRIADHNRKVQVLRAFAEGATSQGANVIIQSEYKIVPARLAVIIGWVGTTISGPHITLRQEVIKHQKQTNGHIMPIDGSCFKFVDKNNEFLRYSLGGVYYNTNNYANVGSNDQKWNQIQKSLHISLAPWRNKGNYVLVCLQRDGGWSMKGTNMAQWTQDIVYKIRKLTQQSILIRPHPKHKTNIKHLLTLPNVYCSANTSTLQQDVSNAWASVFYNSSAVVASIINGIPAFVNDSDCVAWAISNQKLDNLESPIMSSREQWLYDLSAAHWTDDESRQGLIFKKFQQYL